MVVLLSPLDFFSEEAEAREESERVKSFFPFNEDGEDLAPSDPEEIENRLHNSVSE